MAFASSRATTAILVLLLVLSRCWYGMAASATPDKKDAVRKADEGQVRELQKQVADLKKELRELQQPRVVAAGTATWTRPRVQANRTSTRVKLAPELTARLGKDYIVLLTNRFPVGGFPYFVCYWKVADDGFDITLVDPPLNDGTTASYTNSNTSYLVDWAVVKK